MSDLGGYIYTIWQKWIKLCFHQCIMTLKNKNKCVFITYIPSSPEWTNQTEPFAFHEFYDHGSFSEGFEGDSEASELQSAT